MSVEGPLRSGDLNGTYFHVCPECPFKNAQNSVVNFQRTPCSPETQANCKEEFDNSQVSPNQEKTTADNTLESKV